MKCVRVVWHDAHDGSETWMAVEDIEDGPYVVTSIGFLIEGRKQGHIVLCQSLGEGGEHVDNVLAIPLGMIQTIEELS